MGMAPASREVFKQDLLRLVGLKYRLRECAGMLHLSYDTVRRYAAEPSFLAQLKELSQEAWQQVEDELAASNFKMKSLMEENSFKALLKLGELIESKTEIIALKAATDMLDRNAETAKNTHATVESTFKIDPVLLVHAAATAREVDEFEAKKLGDGGTTVQ